MGFEGTERLRSAGVILGEILDELVVLVVDTALRDETELDRNSISSPSKKKNLIISFLSKIEKYLIDKHQCKSIIRYVNLYN